MTIKVYLAGPMRGIPQFNFPAFERATNLLRDMGLEVFSPAENDINNGFDPSEMSGDNAELGPAGFDLRKALSQDLQYVCEEADAVVVLPGWRNSMGATSEVCAALAVGLPVYNLSWEKITWEELQSVG